MWQVQIAGAGPAKWMQKQEAEGIGELLGETAVYQAAIIKCCSCSIHLAAHALDSQRNVRQ